ncbi:MAG: hypothetical protein ACI9FJ_000452, partial [Alteromonadaceae bacterium]
KPTHQTLIEKRFSSPTEPLRNYCICYPETLLFDRSPKLTTQSVVILTSKIA